MGIIPSDRGQRGPSQRAPIIMQTVETKEVETESVSCDGGGGALGHPKVYLTFDDSGEIECPYCSRRFARKKGKRRDGH
jgi:uncharacterized Zn-finger protein